MNGSLVQLKNVTKYYNEKVCALNDISFSIARGEWVSIMGPSGSGKTTLLNIISCLDQPSEGMVTIDGKDIGEFKADQLALFRRETVGLIFQQFHLIPYLSALENVMLAQYFHSVVDEDQAMQTMDRVGLADRVRHLPGQLSGGEQQRVCIARALINEPKLILADEPTGNLDEKNEEIVMDIFRDLHREGRSIAVVTHDETIGMQAQRIIRLEHGRITDNSRRDC